jgi:hypothetical protein
MWAGWGHFVVGKAAAAIESIIKQFQKTVRLECEGLRGPYRDRLHQLNNQMETIDKKISQLRNFKADNTSPSGGINASWVLHDARGRPSQSWKRKRKSSGTNRYGGGPGAQERH